MAEKTLADSVSNAVVAVQATQLTSEDRNRTQSISDLFAWCGDGTPTPHELHAYLRPDTSKPLARAAALLVGGPSGRHYLVTACNVLSDPAAAGPAPQDSMEPDDSESDGAPASEARPVYGMTEIAFAERALPEALRRGLFPAASFPHLDLSLVWLDQANPDVCVALTKAGFAFVAMDRIADEPSADGAKILLIGPGAYAAVGNVTGATRPLSFFWIDTDILPDMGGAPVVEGESIVGFATHLSSSVATIAKAGSLRALVAAHESAHVPA